MSPSTPEPAKLFTDARRFELLVDAVTDYAICMLAPDGLVTSWNSGAQRLKGYRPAEIIGQHFSRFFTQEDRERRLPARIVTEAESKGRCESEGWRGRKDGAKFWAGNVTQANPPPPGGRFGLARNNPHSA